MIHDDDIDFLVQKSLGRLVYKVGDPLSHGYVVASVDDDGNINGTVTAEDYARLQQGAPPSAIAKEAPVKIKKEVREYMPDGEAQTEGPTMFEVDPDNVARLLDTLSGTGESDEPEMFSPGAANFPTKTLPSAADGRGDDLNAVPKPYDVNKPSTVYSRPPGSVFIASNVDPNIARPEPFKVPAPAPLLLKSRGDAWLNSEGDSWQPDAEVKKSQGSIFKDVVQRSNTGHEDQLFGSE